MIEENVLGNKVKNLRLKMKLTQEQFAKKMEDVELEDIEIETPICKMKTKSLNEDNFVFVPILRAGMGMVDGVINVIPNAKIGHIGMYRDEENNHKPVNYFFKVPENIEKKEVIILDPMLATGGSAIDAINLIKENYTTSTIP